MLASIILVFHLLTLHSVSRCLIGIYRFYYDLEIITRERHKQNNKQTGRKQFVWLRKRRQTRAVFGWLIANTQGKEKLDCELKSSYSFQLISLAFQHYDRSIEQATDVFSGKTSKACFDAFIYWRMKQIADAQGNYFSRSNESRCMLNIRSCQCPE